MGAMDEFKDKAAGMADEVGDKFKGKKEDESADEKSINWEGEETIEEFEGDEKLRDMAKGHRTT